MPITPKYFFRLNKSLHLFETHCSFLPLFNPNIDLLQAVKVTKSGHYLSQDRVSKALGLFLFWRHKLLCMHVYKDLIRCKSVCDLKQGIDPCPLLARSFDRWWLDFVTFRTWKKSTLSLKRHSAFRTGAKIYLSKKKYIFGVMGTLNVRDRAVSLKWFPSKRTRHRFPMKLGMLMLQDKEILKT